MMSEVGSSASGAWFENSLQIVSWGTIVRIPSFVFYLSGITSLWSDIQCLRNCCFVYFAQFFVSGKRINSIHVIPCYLTRRKVNEWAQIPSQGTNTFPGVSIGQPGWTTIGPSHPNSFLKIFFQKHWIDQTNPSIGHIWPLGNHFEIHCLPVSRHSLFILTHLNLKIAFTFYRRRN